MRAFLLLAMLFFISSFQSRHHAAFKSSYYYFCDSHPVSWDQSQGKKNILYTDIAQIDCEEPYFRTLAEEWGKMANNNCKNENGCTSDLNYYHSMAEAKKQFDNLLRRYTDTSIYNLKKVTLKVSTPQEK